MDINITADDSSDEFFSVLVAQAIDLLHFSGGAGSAFSSLVLSGLFVAFLLHEVFETFVDRELHMTACPSRSSIASPSWSSLSQN